MDMRDLGLLGTLVRRKAVLRGLLAQYGLYEEKVMLRPASSGLLTVECRCSAAGYGLEGLAAVLAAREDVVLLGELARSCFPITTREIGIWLDNFSDITEVIMLTSANVLPFLNSSGSFLPQTGASGGLCGTYRKGDFYIPVYCIAERAEREVLLLKTGKFGILRQHIPLPTQSGDGVVKTMFYCPSEDVFSQTLEYLARKGFLGYALQIPQ